MASASCSRAAATLFQRIIQVRSRATPRRGQPENDSRSERENQCKREHRAIDAQRQAYRQMQRWQEKCQQVRSPQREEYSPDATCGGEQETFDEQLAQQPFAAGSQRSAYGNFPFAGGRASEQQVRHVDASNQQYEQSNYHQKAQNASKKILHAIVRAPYRRQENSDALLRIRIFLLKIGVQRGHLGLRLRDGYARF